MDKKSKLYNPGENATVDEQLVAFRKKVKMELKSFKSVYFKSFNSHLKFEIIHWRLSKM